MTPRHVSRIYGEQRIDIIAPIGSTGVGRTRGCFGTSYLMPGEFERLKAEGVEVVTMAQIEAIERQERRQECDDTGDDDPRQMDLF